MKFVPFFFDQVYIQQVSSSYCFIMMNKCVACGCYLNYASEGGETVSTFKFPFKKLELLKRWIKFVNRADWKPSGNSVLCVKHFKEEF